MPVGSPEVKGLSQGPTILLQGSFFCDLILIYLIKKSHFYRNKKFEEVL